MSSLTFKSAKLFAFMAFVSAFLSGMALGQSGTIDLTNAGTIAVLTNSYGTIDYVSNPGANLKAQQQFTVTNGQTGWSTDSASTSQPLTSVPIVIYQGVKYFGIAMDVNEGSGSRADFDIPQVMIWAGSSTANTDVAGTSTKLANPFQTYSQLNDNSTVSGLTLIYQQNLSPQVGTGSIPYGNDPSRMVGQNSQSGSSGVDIAILIPISVLNGISTNSKIYIGVQTGSLDDAGPEQIGFIDPSNLTVGGWLATNTTVTSSFFQANTKINATSSPLSFTTTMSRSFSNSGATTATLNLMGALTFTKGEGTVTVLNPASQNSTLTFDTLTRSGASTGNFITPDPINNKITFSAPPPTTNSIISTGLFLNGSNYAAYDSSGYVRALNYASDSNTASSAGGTTLGAVSGKDVQVTGAATGQTSLAVNSLKIAGDYAITLGASQTLATNGILKTGGTGTTISGGSGAAIQANTNQDLVIRVDSATDNLTVNTNITANGSNQLIKAGAGNLTLNGSGTYTGTTSINAGTLTVNSSLSGTSVIEIENTGTLAGSGTVGAASAQTNLRAGGVISPGGNGGASSGVLTLNGSLSTTATSSINLQLNADGYSTSAMTRTGALNTAVLSNTANRVAGANDRLNVTGSLNLSAGTAINVVLQGGYQPRAGDAFDLLDWSVAFNLNGFTYGSGLRTGTVTDNASYDLKLPDLTLVGSGLYWDTSQFSTLGVITVVPEPARCAYLTIGVFGLLFRRRRKPSLP